MERIKLSEGLTQKNYIIPCFQREYSWGEEEIVKLIKDIKNIKDKEEYCLGIVTVKKSEEKFLLIDGLQRLTTLYMIAIYCDYIKKEDEIKLSSEYENLISKSNNLILIKEDNTDNLPYNFKVGWEIIKKYIKGNNEKEDIKRKIKENLYYYEITLDNNTNINHYFEVMNSRGVQLSRSDIVKSLLMNIIEDDNKSRLNYLWYLFEKMDNQNQKINKFSDISKNYKLNYRKINDILNNDIEKYKKEEQLFKDQEKNEDSILDFEYFLLYTIRLYKNREKLDEDIKGEFNLDSLVTEYEIFKDKKSEDIVEFLDFLISVKNIYDKYIIKRDNVNDNWELESKYNKQNMILIQSCLRVSFVSKTSMHWVYKTLAFFYKNIEKNEKEKIDEYIKEMENFIRVKYVKDFIEENKEKEYKTGLNTPHIVLNYLDYLIKKNKSEIIVKATRDLSEDTEVIKKIENIAKELKFDEFKFKFRNSIEHFYARNLAKKNGNDWDDDFGNLALLASGTNTRMQDAEPEDKANHFNKDGKLSDYSLKLQIMSKITSKNGWEKENCKFVREICINILERDLKQGEDECKKLI